MLGVMVSRPTSIISHVIYICKAANCGDGKLVWTVCAVDVPFLVTEEAIDQNR